MKLLKNVLFILVIGLSVLVLSGCNSETDNEPDNNSSTLPSHILGIYTNKGMRGNTGICDTFAFKLNSTSVQWDVFSQSLGCTTDFDFSNSTKYEIQNVKETGSNGENYSFDLYSNSGKEYQCKRYFGRLSCTSNKGTTLEYQQYYD